MLIKSIAVFCGSQMGKDEAFAITAKAVGKWMAEHHKTLIYGGGNVGLMGVVANAVLNGGGKVTGVIPKILDERERSHKGLARLLVVDDMHIRKRKMYELCDAAIILPGGYGTMDEFFEMITWNNLSIHDKNIYILNINGFYNHLLQHVKAMHEAGFLYEDPLSQIKVMNSANELQDAIPIHHPTY